MDYRNHIDQIKRGLEEEGIDGMILSPSSDLAYVTDVKILSMERPAFLMILCGNIFFVMPQFELLELHQKEQDFITYIGWREEEDPYEKILEYVQNERLVMAVEPEMPVRMYIKLQSVFPDWIWVSGEKIMSSIRSKKSNEEYACLKQAHVKSGKAFDRLLESGLQGKTEIQIARMLRNFMEKEGLECSGLPLVAAGENSAKPHHYATERMINDQDVVLIDFGGKYNGYYSDITRTVVVRKPPAGFEEIYRIVCKANEMVLKMAKPEMTAEELDTVARVHIERAGYGRYFTHRLGHGTGRDIHENPYIAQGNKEKLVEGNVFSNEPGIYLPDRYGIRIEDVLFLHKEGAECLTDLTHDLRIIR